MEFTNKDFAVCETVLIGGINIEYWVKRVNDRLNFLNPLINELTLKGINLIDISKELNSEYNSLIMMKIKYL